MGVSENGIPVDIHPIKKNNLDDSPVDFGEAYFQTKPYSQKTDCTNWNGDTMRRCITWVCLKTRCNFNMDDDDDDDDEQRDFRVP